MASTTSDMPLSGGHAALDFVNTVDSRRGRWGPDLLGSLGDLVVLAERLNLVDPGKGEILRGVAAADTQDAGIVLLEAVNLREAAYGVFVAEDRGGVASTSMLRVLEQAAHKARARQVLKMTPEGLRWKLPLEERRDIVDLFALEVVELLIEASVRRPVRECKGDNCGWLFLDRSKGGRRIWCSEASCGTRERSRRLRSRRIRDQGKGTR
jgi:predicted RNA-binding Zn ribbon-like protein